MTQRPWQSSLWQRLLEYVATWASVREVAGGIEVAFEQAPGSARTVEVVVTRAQWADYTSTVFGTDDPRATPLRERLRAMPDDARYLVYDTYDWLPSATRELPPDEPSEGTGEWVITDEEGRVVDRFADFAD